MKTEFIEPIFLMEIGYKSGYSFKMWFKDFQMSGDEISWEVPDGAPRPLKIGVDDIVSVIQIDIKELSEFDDLIKS